LTSFTAKIKKLKGLKMDEISVRVAQQVAILSERSGWSKKVSLPSDEQLLNLLGPDLSEASYFTCITDVAEHLRLRNEPRFFASFDSKEHTLLEFRQRWPEMEQAVIDAANRIAAGVFSVLGLRELDVGKNIDWHLEPVSGKRTPLCHWSQLNYLDATIAGDKKITWELNRHQYFLTLGRAYWLTDDERYAQVFVSHVTSWIEQNPPKLGINWASSLEIAFRSISWLWALRFFEKSPSMDPALLLRIVKVLYLNASHLETYLSTYFSPNTHLTGEALGLFYIGLLLPEFKDAKRWRELGLKILIDELPRHVKPDGVYFEQSSHYHRYTADFYTHLAILLRINGMTLPHDLEPKLQLLLDHLMYITRPDGTSPLFGDDDGGRLVVLDDRPTNDFRSSLSTGAVLFNRPDYKFVAGAAAEETLWLLGPAGLRSLDLMVAEKPAKESVGFSEGGYYVMRDDWSSTANYLLFDCGPHGFANCGHAHADALSIELAARGQTLLVDPGTFTYTGDKEMRDWFRSSVAHNTLTVDRKSSSISGDTFSWQTATPCERLAWIDHNRFTYVSGTHAGYQPLGKPGTHTRSILFFKHDYWLLRDRIELNGRHQVDQWFHFHFHAPPNVLQIVSFADGGRWTQEEGWVSDCYGERVSAPVLVFSASCENYIEITTFLIPPPVTGTVKAKVKQIDVAGGRGFEVSNGRSRDLVITRDQRCPGVARASSVVSDFECTWMRFVEADQAPDEMLLLGGRALEFEGQNIVESCEQVEYSWLRKDSQQGIYVRN
jgi:hypothetical protein